MTEDGGVAQQRQREAAEEAARRAAQTGDEYMELLADGLRYESKQDWRKAGKVYRKAIALRSNEPEAYYNLGAVLANSEHNVEAAQRFLEARTRFPVGSEHWALATASAFDMLRLTECDEVAKPEWWNDERLKALSARVVREAPNHAPANIMRADVLSGQGGAWKAGPRSAAELKEAAAYWDRAAAMSSAPAAKADYASLAVACRSRVEAM
eukprot:scaffold28160_cov39-Phaeocystis_antarctica.AAC.1